MAPGTFRARCRACKRTHLLDVLLQLLHAVQQQLGCARQNGADVEAWEAASQEDDEGCNALHIARNACLRRRRRKAVYGAPNDVQRRLLVQHLPSLRLALHRGTE